MAPTATSRRPGAWLWRTVTPTSRIGPPPAGGGQGLVDAGDVEAAAPSSLRSTAYRLRRQAVPHAVAGTALAGGLAAYAVAAATGDPGQVAFWAGALTYPAVLLAYAVGRGRINKPWRSRVLAGGLTGATWVTLAAFGVAPGTVALLLAAEYSLAARWWQAHRISHAPARVERHGESRTQTQVEWETYVAFPGGPAAGSRLVDPQPFAYGETFTLLLARGRQTFTAVQAKLHDIASGLDTGITNLVLTPHPESRSAARAQLKLLHTSPLEANPTFEGPRARGGSVALGPYADGEGEALYTLYTEDSMWSGVLIGGTGVGKSRVVDNAAISIMARGDTVIIYIDPKEGGSSPSLYTNAHWSGGLGIADPVLNALLRLVEIRNKENYARYSDPGFTPSPSRPGLLIVIDECHRVFVARQKDWAHVARTGRSAGIALLAVSQYAGIETFGGDEALRSSVMMGNTIAMYAPSNTNGRLMPGLNVEPKTLPNIPGYGYTQASDQLGGRTAPWRNRLVPKEDAPAWMTAQPATEPDRVMRNILAREAGAAYTDRHATAELRVAADLAFIEAIEAGDTSVLDRAGHVAAQATVVPFARLGGRGTVRFPPAPQNAAQEAHVAPRRALELTAAHRAVLNAIAGGATRPVEIEEALGLGGTRVKNLLRELIEAEVLTRSKPHSRHGSYSIVQAHDRSA